MSKETLESPDYLGQLETIRREAWREGAKAMQRNIVRAVRPLHKFDASVASYCRVPRFPTSWPPKGAKK